MKKFAIYQPHKESPEIVEGISAAVKRQKDGLKISILQSDKTKIIFTGATIFTEVCKEIKIY